MKMSPWLSFKIYSTGLTGFNLAFPILLIATYATFEGVTLGDVLGLIAALIVYKTCIYFLRKNRYSEGVNHLWQFLGDEEFKEIFKNTRKKQLRGDLETSLYNMSAAVISLSQQKRDCSNGHTIGCEHYPLTEKREYYSGLNTMIRRGNDPVYHNYHRKYYRHYYKKAYGTLE